MVGMTRWEPLQGNTDHPQLNPHHTHKPRTPNPQCLPPAPAVLAPKLVVARCCMYAVASLAGGGLDECGSECWNADLGFRV